MKTGQLLPRLARKSLPFENVMCDLETPLTKMNQFHKHANVFIPQMLRRTFRTGECIVGDLSYI